MPVCLCSWWSYGRHAPRLIAFNTANVVVDPATGRIDTGVSGFYD